MRWWDASTSPTHLPSRAARASRAARMARATRAPPRRARPPPLPPVLTGHVSSFPPY